MFCLRMRIGGSLMDSLGKIFFRGLVTLLPIAVTIYVLYSAIIILENLLGGILRQILPSYVPGLGLIVILILIFVFGLILNNYLASRFWVAIEQKITEVPFIKAIYSPLRDLMNMFSNKSQKSLQQVVLVRLGSTGAHSLGLVTREQFTDLKMPGTTDKVAVLFPFSYALGGITLLIPREMITPIDMPIEKAMSLAITGWVKLDKNDTPVGEKPPEPKL